MLVGEVADLCVTVTNTSCLTIETSCGGVGKLMHHHAVGMQALSLSGCQQRITSICDGGDGKDRGERN